MKKVSNRKPLKYYQDLKYPVSIEGCPDGGYFVEIPDLPGCYSQGETVEEACKMIEEARQLWMESMYEDDNDIPLPKSEVEYSGKFIVRVPKSLHAKLDKLAAREGVSLNTLVTVLIVEGLGSQRPRTAQSPRAG